MPKIISVGIESIKASSFSAINNSVLLEINFNDGARKQIFRTTHLGEPEKIPEIILEEIRKMEYNINREFDGSIREGDVKVVIKNDENDRKEIKKFFINLSGMTHRIKNTKIANGYLDLIRVLQKSELKLT